MLEINPLSAADKHKLDDLYANMQIHNKTLAGYPCNTQFDYSELYRFLQFTINNIGDPFEYSNFQSNTHEFEQEVIRFFAEILQAGDCYRGYVSHGGTEGNIFGLDLGLQRFPDAILYYSNRAHYSIDKIARLLKVKVEKIPALENGEINYAILRDRIITNKDKPVLVNVNIGTTMTGAVDDLAKIKAILSELEITDYHLHGDAALSGMILPFVDKPQPYNFADGIQSIAISGHKFIGSPLPCGIALTNQNPPNEYNPTISYVKVTDNTISGSRNGFTPLIMWYAIKRYGKEGFRNLVHNCFDMVDYAKEKFNASGVAAWSNSNSVTLVFPRPSEEVICKWQLAPHNDIAHMMLMPQANKYLVDSVLQDIVNLK